MGIIIIIIIIIIIQLSYSAAGISIFWLVDLSHMTLVVTKQPPWRHYRGAMAVV